MKLTVVVAAAALLLVASCGNPPDDTDNTIQSSASAPTALPQAADPSTQAAAQKALATVLAAAQHDATASFTVDGTVDDRVVQVQGDLDLGTPDSRYSYRTPSGAKAAQHVDVQVRAFTGARYAQVPVGPISACWLRTTTHASPLPGVGLMLLQSQATGFVGGGRSTIGVTVPLVSALLATWPSLVDQITSAKAAVRMPATVTVQGGHVTAIDYELGDMVLAAQEGGFDLQGTLEGDSLTQQYARDALGSAHLTAELSDWGDPQPVAHPAADTVSSAKLRDAASGSVDDSDLCPAAR